jgi:hypothetical protein
MPESTISPSQGQRILPQDPDPSLTLKGLSQVNKKLRTRPRQEKNKFNETLSYLLTISSLVKMTFDHEYMEDYPTKTILAIKVSRSSPFQVKPVSTYDVQKGTWSSKTLGTVLSKDLVKSLNVVQTKAEFLLIQFILVDILVFLLLSFATQTVFRESIDKRGK